MGLRVEQENVSLIFTRKKPSWAGWILTATVGKSSRVTYTRQLHAQNHNTCAKNTPKQSNNTTVEAPTGCSLCLSLMTSQNLAQNKSPELLQPRSQGAAGFKAASVAHSPDACPTCFPARSMRGAGAASTEGQGLPGDCPQCSSAPRPSCVRGTRTLAPSAASVS